MEALARAPWLLPLVWAVREGYACDHVVVAEALGVPSRLARSLVHYGKGMGLCDGVPESLCMIREGPEFYARVGGLLIYARVRRRRVTGYVFSTSGVYVGSRKRLYERVRRVLESLC